MRNVIDAARGLLRFAGGGQDAVDDLDDALEDYSGDAAHEALAGIGVGITANEMRRRARASTEEGPTELPPAECVYCGQEVADPAAHHLNRHPGKRFDPVWYLDDDELEDVVEIEVVDVEPEEDVEEDSEFEFQGDEDEDDA